MIQRSEAEVPEMLTEPGKWLEGGTLLFFQGLLRHDTRNFFPHILRVRFPWQPEKTRTSQQMICSSSWGAE